MQDEFTTLVRAALDEPLVALGFAAGQGGLGDDSGMVIFCTTPESFMEHFGGTAFARDFVSDGGCIDLVVDAVRTDRWHAVGVRVDSGSRYVAMPELPRETLADEVRYIADRLVPMLNGAAEVEFAPPGWQPEIPASARLPRQDAGLGPLPKALLSRGRWGTVGK